MSTKSVYAVHKSVHTEDIKISERMPLTHTYNHELFDIEIVFDDVVTKIYRTDKRYLTLYGNIKITTKQKNIQFEADVGILNTRDGETISHTCSLFLPTTIWTMNNRKQSRSVSSAYVMSCLQQVFGYTYIHEADDAFNTIILTMLEPHFDTIRDMLS